VRKTYLRTRYEEEILASVRFCLRTLLKNASSLFVRNFSMESSCSEFLHSSSAASARIQLLQRRLSRWTKDKSQYIKREWTNWSDRFVEWWVGLFRNGRRRSGVKAELSIELEFTIKERMDSLQTFSPASKRPVLILHRWRSSLMPFNDRETLNGGSGSQNSSFFFSRLQCHFDRFH